MDACLLLHCCRSGLREQSEKKRETELYNKSLVLFANLEYDYGKYFYEFFYAACNLLLYYRGLHSKKFFAMRDSRMFSLQLPVILAQNCPLILRYQRVLEV